MKFFSIDITFHVCNEIWTTVLNPLNLYLNYFSQMQFFIKKKNNFRKVLRILSKNVER